MTIIVLVAVSIKAKGRLLDAPASLSLPFSREGRE